MARLKTDNEKGIEYNSFGEKFITFNEADPDPEVVSMMEFKGKMYIATKRGIYTIKDNQLVRIKFKKE